MTIEIINVEFGGEYTLGYTGENDATLLQIPVPVEYAGKTIYLDFALPGAEPTRTPPLAESRLFPVPWELLTMRGHGRCDVVYSDAESGVVKLLGYFSVVVKEAVNASAILERQYNDVIQDLQERMESWESAKASKEAAEAAATAAGESASAASGSATAAKTSEDNAKASKEAAAGSAAAAAGSAAAAKTSEDNAKSSEDGALDSKKAAAQSLSDLLAMLGVDVATLTGGKLTPSQIPAIAITDTFVKASEAEMLALAAQTGDVCIRTDESKTYILQGDDPGELTDWQQLRAPTNYADQAGHASTADEAVNAQKINNHRLVTMTEEQYAGAVLDEGTLYAVYPAEES